MAIFDYFNLNGGMNRLANRMAIPPTQADWIDNLHWQNQQGWSNQSTGCKTMNPTTPLNSGAKILSLFGFLDTYGVYQTLAQAGNQLYKIDPLTGDILESLGEVSSSPCQYTVILGWCIVVGKDKPPLRWNGQTALEPLPNWPPNLIDYVAGNPSLAATYANRLILAGDPTFPNAVYISANEDPETFTPNNALEESAGAIQVSPGDGQYITALVPMFVPYNNEQILLIFKNRSIYALKGNSASDFTLQQVANHVGAVSPKAVLTVGQEVWFLSEQGISSLGVNTQLGVLALGNLSAQVQQLTTSLNRSQLHKAFAYHDVARQEVWWWVAEGSSNTPNRVWIQKNLEGKSVWSVRSGLTAFCGLAFPTGELITGTSGGFWHQQRIGSSYNGGSINWQYKTAPLALASASLSKRLSSVDLYVREISQSSLNITAEWDLGRSITMPLTPTVDVGANQQINLYGQAVYNLQRYTSGLSGVVRIFPDGMGSLFQLSLSGTLPLQPFTLEGFSFRTIEGGSVQL
jgi:hypothetical protein